MPKPKKRSTHASKMFVLDTNSHITLEKGERSQLADLASELL